MRIQKIYMGSTEVTLIKIKITIIGKVHNVGYRPFLLDLADSLLIERFDARNVTIEGKQAVVVLVEGRDEMLNQFVETIKKEKPENAVVEEIRVEEFKGFVRPIDSYRQSLMVNQLNKIVQVGLQMLKLEKQDQMIQKQDVTIKEIKERGNYLCEKIEYLGEKIDNLSSKVEKMGEKIDKVGENITHEIKELRFNLKAYLDERLRKMESEIQIIKSKLGMD